MGFAGGHPGRADAAGLAAARTGPPERREVPKTAAWLLSQRALRIVPGLCAHFWHAITDVNTPAVMLLLLDVVW